MELRSDQDSGSVEFMLDLCRGINAKVYMEIGCGQLGTFERFRVILPRDGFAIGLDSREYNNWKEYIGQSFSEKECNIFLSDRGLDHKTVISSFEDILGDRKVDFLFIDGDHSVEAVDLDWKDFSPFVRRGGIIAFHDVDWGAVNRGQLEGQGSGMKLKQLMVEGYEVFPIPGAIGMAYVIKQ